MLFEHERAFDAFYENWASQHDEILLKHFGGGISLTHVEQSTKLYWVCHLLKYPYQNNTSHILLPRISFVVNRMAFLDRDYHTHKISFTSRGKIVRANFLLDTFLSATHSEENFQRKLCPSPKVQIQAPPIFQNKSL